jgi:hypothetical protein
MGKWSKSLPKPMENYTDRAANALSFIGKAMMEDLPTHSRVANMRQAAAEVRAWRKSLDGESCREGATGGVRTCLRLAAKCVLWADAGRIRMREEYLRGAEAYLREAARLLDREQT